MRLVTDSNVIVSGPNYSGSEAQILGLAAEGRVELVLSETILTEVFRTLLYKFDWSSSASVDALEELRDVARIVDPPKFTSAVPGDHPDNRVLDCAVYASADYLVTGDRKHLLPLGEFEGVRILRAPDFIKMLDDD